jgi:hypothetical protein
VGVSKVEFRFYSRALAVRLHSRLAGVLPRGIQVRLVPPTKRASLSLIHHRHLKPGGWYEQIEYAVRWSADDDSIPKGHVFDRWGDVFEEAGEKMGKTFKILDQQKQFLLDHGGFTNVTEQRYKMPVGPWSREKKLKEVGRWHLLECYEGIEGWSMAMLTRLMGVSSGADIYSVMWSRTLTDSVFSTRSGQPPKFMSSSQRSGRRSRTARSTAIPLCKSADIFRTVVADF